MSEPRTLDVSHLPAHAFGLRSVLVWGALLSICIEGTVMALMLVSFVYLRGNDTLWPPAQVGHDAFRLAAIQMGLLLISILPNWLMDRAAVREDFGATRRQLAIGTVLALAITALRGIELPRIAFRWDDHAYGSAFWMVVGIHVTHLLSGAVEYLLLLALMVFAPERFEKKHYMDLEASGILWYFVVAEWAIAYPVLYLMPLGRSR